VCVCVCCECVRQMRVRGTYAVRLVLISYDDDPPGKRVRCTRKLPLVVVGRTVVASTVVYCVDCNVCTPLWSYRKYGAVEGTAIYRDHPTTLLDPLILQLYTKYSPVSTEQIFLNTNMSHMLCNYRYAVSQFCQFPPKS